VKRRRSYPTARDYPRTARLNQLFLEILADELERIDDDRLQLVTVMSVEVDSDLRHAVVYYDSPAGEAADDEIQRVLAERRPRLQAAINRQARVKRVPELAFRPDDVERSAARVEDILRDLED
jgi:ribosome-binding factor A